MKKTSEKMEKVLTCRRTYNIIFQCDDVGLGEYHSPDIG